ncbi:glutamate-rich WD repeat containing 1 [Coprinopsis marcescibilis]|uniref:Glutamate-rich WD repeat-containing protein 1 n=1 Tax=Coprinopsis marcescibilis TaxID=230819 RepID=A0A5C3LCP6_COPMA|nr:glutamate-rich WD repeat containing 1 [Coprinopsis marcescibilis]
MSKRPADPSTSTQGSDGQPFAKVHGSASRREPQALNEMGEFEDAWEDEVESDEEVVDAQANDEDGMDIDSVMPAIEESDEPAPVPRAYVPGLHTLESDEVLVADESVYIMRHSMNVNWPCLSFDVLRDNLGDERRRFPATAYIVAGTQAAEVNKNEVVVYKMSSLHKTQKDGDDSDVEDEDDDADDLDEDPIIEFRSIPHVGGINRIRAQPLPPSTPLPDVSQPYYVASSAETGKVHIWDVRPLIESLDVPGYTYDKARVQKPAFTINSHGRAEGFALDWASSGSSSLRILTGDIHSKIYLTTSTPSGFNALSQPFVSHTSSIEDIQWSPSEPTVFASCSADHTIQIWDVRTKGRKSVAGITPAHEADVNVISWNRLTTYLLLSGGDEGGIKVWDLRNIKKKGSSDPDPAPVASFNWHSGPITSVEWHPTEDSVFAASSADNQVTLWDLAVEHDTDEAGMEDVPEGGKDIPSQLLFQHLGQKDIKELHWHPQIPGTIVSTAADGFNVFKTFNV